MEKGESMLEAISEDEDLADGEDVEMLDVEEGELVAVDCSRSENDRERSGVADVNGENRGSGSKSKKRRANKRKRKKKKKKGGSGDKSLDINQRLKEKKSYMVYTAVGCLGLSKLTDLVSQVDAIQSCGGQMTADGKRCRTGGGILWNILKVREPAAYREIMKRTKDFEKQFRQQNTGRAARNKGSSSRETVCEPTVEASASIPEDLQLLPQIPPEQFGADGEQKSVNGRIRVPVSYEDLD
ncbi:hypothetical protein V6N11_066912 [Hibiscus sabdariffa]|uniref:Phosphorylated adapter RNA export protein n=1 Tax=Hibiscus sabdariffa TaxID=183260 RepID=A0ABR2SPU0_9ROSI